MTLLTFKQYDSTMFQTLPHSTMNDVKEFGSISGRKNRKVPGVDEVLTWKRHVN